MPSKQFGQVYCVKFQLGAERPRFVLASRGNTDRSPQSRATVATVEKVEIVQIAHQPLCAQAEVHSKLQMNRFLSHLLNSLSCSSISVLDYYLLSVTYLFCSLSSQLFHRRNAALKLVKNSDIEVDVQSSEPLRVQSRGYWTSPSMMRIDWYTNRVRVQSIAWHVTVVDKYTCANDESAEHRQF